MNFENDIFSPLMDMNNNNEEHCANLTFVDLDNNGMEQGAAVSTHHEGQVDFSAFIEPELFTSIHPSFLELDKTRLLGENRELRADAELSGNKIRAISSAIGKLRTRLEDCMYRMQAKHGDDAEEVLELLGLLKEASSIKRIADER